MVAPKAGSPAAWPTPDIAIWVTRPGQRLGENLGGSLDGFGVDGRLRHADLRRGWGQRPRVRGQSSDVLEGFL
jgi:hypothetical protein